MRHPLDRETVHEYCAIAGAYFIVFVLVAAAFGVGEVPQ